MPDNTEIERTIFKVELDGSAYIAGAESLTKSTEKLSDAQAKANKKLEELQKQEKEVKKSFEEVTAVIKANEKETVELTKKLDDLKNAGKGASAEATRLKAELKGLSTNTKEFKIEAAELKSGLTNVTTQIKTQTKEIQTLEKANTNFTQGLGKAYTGLSKIAQIIPGLGIGGLIGLVAGPLVGALQSWVGSLFEVSEALERTARVQKIVTDITNESIKSSTGDIVHLEQIKKKLDDLSIPQKERIALAKEYNKTADEGNKIDLKQIDNISLVNHAIDTQIAKIKERALAKAAENIITQKAEVLQLAQEQARVKNVEFSKQATEPIPGQAKGNLMDQYVQEIKQKSFLAKQIANDPEVIKAQQELEDALNAGSKFITIGGLTTGKPDKTEKAKTVKALKEIENVYLAEKEKLDEQLKVAKGKAEDEESQIRIDFAVKIAKEKSRILQLLKDKKITKPQSTALIEEAEQINAELLLNALKELNKKRLAEQERHNKELLAIQNKNIEDQLNLIQDEFTRRAKLIDFQEKKELAAVGDNELAKQNIIEKFARQRQALSADIFQSLLDQYGSAIKSADLIRDEQTAKDVKALAEKLQSGKITYDQFQKEITKIKKKAEQDRKEGTLAVDKSELAALDQKLESIIDKNSAYYKKIKKQRDEQASKVAKEEIDIASGAGDGSKKTDPKIARIQKYAEAIGSIVTAVIGFWQKANDAEQKALDRSITLQEKRVEAAQRIAARGNAQYLKEEEDRLKELNIKRENAARRQLGIDAALQASQILVAITGAIAKIATPGTGIAEVIASMAVIFGSLATGYGLVKSLQGNQPKLFVGTKDTGPGGNQDSKGGFTATLHPHEAVIPADKNKAYHPAVSAIYDGTIPAEHLNAFVKNFHRVKSIPQPNYQRIHEAAEMHISQNGKLTTVHMEKKLEELVDLQRHTIRTLHKMGVNVSLDQHGFAVTQMEVIEQMNRDKRI